MTMIGGFSRGAGWPVRDGLGLSLQELERIVAVEWFEVIGLSASCDRHLDLLSFTLTRLRQGLHAIRALGFWWAERSLFGRPGLLALVGADATAGGAFEALREARAAQGPVTLDAGQCRTPEAGWGVPSTGSGL
jgi:hypothetical protein